MGVGVEAVQDFTESNPKDKLAQIVKSSWQQQNELPWKAVLEKSLRMSGSKPQSFPAMDAAEHSRNQGMPKGKPKQTKTNQVR